MCWWRVAAVALLDPAPSRAAPLAPENFPCMRAAAPLSSRSTHSVFSQEQSVTSEPSTSL